MIVSLIGHERNLGILTLTDYLLEKLGKSNCVVLGWNYLILDSSSILKKIKENSKTKSVIVKYVVPRARFSSNQEIIYPKDLHELSDVVFRVPTYREEISEGEVPKIFFKGQDNPIEKYISSFYSVTEGVT